MKVFIDTEFIDTGREIDLISIGLVREDGQELYLESSEVDWSKASDWVNANVKTKLGPEDARISRAEIRDRVREFCGDKPSFWAYFADYDWIVLCQLFGTMLSVPKGWPHLCLDLKQLMMFETPYTVFPGPKDEHNALADARWVRDVYDAVIKMKGIR